MTKAIVKVNGEIITKCFDHICQAMQWVRSFAESVQSVSIFDASGKLYYGF